MHTVELRTEAVDLCRRLGYVVRQEWLGGSGGGACEIKGRKVLFLDLSLSPAEQLDQALDALHRDSDAARLPMPHELRELLQVRRSA